MESTSAIWKFLEELKSHDEIAEIAINSPTDIFIEKSGKFSHMNVKFTPKDLEQFVLDVAKFNQKVVNKDFPILDGTLPDGGRINIICPPLNRNYPAISIRKYNPKYTNFASAVKAFKLNDQCIQFFKALVKSKMNLLISGGTGSGKTTLLNLLLQETEHDERIITIEDTFELQIRNTNRVQLLSNNNYGAKDLIKNALRMRPDRLIIGEVRGEEVFFLLQAMNTGHQGSMSTLHANGAVEALKRLESLFVMATKDLPLKAIRQQIAFALNFIIQLGKDSQGNRYVEKIAEITGMEGDQILHQDILTFQNGEIQFTGIVPKVASQLQKVGLARDFFRCTLK